MEKKRIRCTTVKEESLSAVKEVRDMKKAQKKMRHQTEILLL